MPDRARRWTRNNQRLLIAAAPVLLALAVIATLLARERIDRTHTMADVRTLLEAAQDAERKDDYARAMDYDEAAARLAERPRPAALPGEIKRRVLALRRGLPTLSNAGLDELHRVARLRYRTAELSRKVRVAAETVSTAADTLRFRLTGSGGDLQAATDDLHRVLAPFYIFERESWLRRPDLALLDPARRKRLESEVNELLFLWAVALDRDADPRPGRHGLDPAAAARLGMAVEVCDRALGFASPDGPWLALRERLGLRLAHATTDELQSSLEAIPDTLSDDPAARPGPEEPTALGCFQWGALRVRQGRRAEAVSCFRKAVRLDPGNSWYQFSLASTYDSAGVELSEALKHYDVAVALEPQSPWVRLCRARLYRMRGAWPLAMDDLQRALSDFMALPPSSRDAPFEQQTRLELGLVRQSLGDRAGARAEFAAVIISDPSNQYAWAARLNRAKLEADAGASGLARAQYEALVAEKPDDRAARLGRARLALRMACPAQAEADLNVVVRAGGPQPARAEALAFRSLARLAQGRPAAALADADEARRLRPAPFHDRLRTRALLALSRGDDLALSSPDELPRLPVNGLALRDDLRRLAEVPLGASDGSSRSLLNRAVARSALGEFAEAAATADRAVAQAPQSARVYMVRAHVRQRAGRLDKAMEDAARARALDPDDPRVWELRGRLEIAAGDPAGGLADLDRAIALGSGASVREPRAAALMALNDVRGAIDDWSRALEHDPENAAAFLGRAEALARLHQWDPAIADLEQAAGWSEGQPALRLRIAINYARCLAQTPDRLPRLVAMIRRAWVSPLASSEQAGPSSEPRLRQARSTISDRDPPGTLLHQKRSRASSTPIGAGTGLTLFCPRSPTSGRHVFPDSPRFRPWLEGLTVIITHGSKTCYA